MPANTRWTRRASSHQNGALSRRGVPLLVPGFTNGTTFQPVSSKAMSDATPDAPVGLPPGRREKFMAAAAALSSGLGGTTIVGDPEAGLAPFIGRLIEYLSERQTIVIRLGPASTPKEMAAAIAAAQAARGLAGTGMSVVLHAINAELLRRDTLDVLNAMATLLADHPSIRLLLTGRPSLLGRLASNAHHPLLAYLSNRIELTSVKPVPVPVARQRPPGPLQLRPPGPSRTAMLLGWLFQGRAATPIWATVLTIAAMLAWLALLPESRVEAVGQRQAAPFVGTPATGFAMPPELAMPDLARAPVSAPATVLEPSNTTAPPVPSIVASPSQARGEAASGLGEAVQGPRTGKVLIVRRGDTLQQLYRRTYKGLNDPPLSEVLAINPDVLHPGATVIMPMPAAGWPQP